MRCRWCIAWCPIFAVSAPNDQSMLLADPRFRRALAFGIHRQAILSQIVAGQETPAAADQQPLPPGPWAADPMGYASDETIEPRPYDAAAGHRPGEHLVAEAAGRPTEAQADRKSRQGTSRQGTPASRRIQTRPPRTRPPRTRPRKTRQQGPRRQGREAQEVRKPKLPPIPPLVLAYPPDEIARAACASIQLQLRMVGIEVELRPLDGALPDRVPDNVDLLYMELATWEPVVDARRLFGSDGIVGGTTRYMGLAAARADDAADWGQVRECLRRVHRICYDDVTIIPLWQLLDHFAVRRGLQGVGGKAVSLYQNVEQWRPTFQYPSEK